MPPYNPVLLKRILFCLTPFCVRCLHHSFGNANIFIQSKGKELILLVSKIWIWIVNFFLQILKINRFRIWVINLLSTDLFCLIGSDQNSFSVFLVFLEMVKSWNKHRKSLLQLKGQYSGLFYPHYFRHTTMSRMWNKLRKSQLHWKVNILVDFIPNISDNNAKNV